MRLLLLVICFSAPLLCVASPLSSDGLTLLSLLNHWTSVPPSISSSWNSSDSTPCSWVGVKCDNGSYLVSLDLTTSGVSGQLGPEIGKLNHLETIVLYNNYFSGIIPSELGNCSLLEYIDLSNNQFRGHIPDALTKLQNLRYMNVYSNLLTGKIPESLFQLPQLEEVYLYYNNISGPIPSNIGNTTKLLKLYLSGNQLSGTIPSSIGNCSNLEALFLDGNILEGTLPQSLNNLQNLVYLDVSNNNLFRSFFAFECNPNLKYLAIRNSNISGTIPSSLGNCTNLGVLYLSMNNITGLIPSELGNLANLYDLNLAQNNLEGPLPQQLSYCSRMGRFDVGFNSLNGSLPSSLTRWSRLKSLILRDNRFSGDFPSFLPEFDQLLDLQLGGNMFGGQIPASIGNMTNLLYGLNLSANRFTGVLPQTIWSLANLVSLDVSSNHLRGSISVLVELLSLIEVNISNNSFGGPIPDGLMKFLKSSPSSFLGLPNLCVCSVLDDLSSENSRLELCGKSKCESTSHEPTSHEPTSHKGNSISGTTSHEGNTISATVILIIEFGSSIIVSLLLVNIFLMFLRRQRSMEEGREEALSDNEVKKFWSIDDLGDNRLIDLRYKREVMKATENFDDQYIIGRGGQGIVYKAELDYGILAVKKVVVARNKRKRLSIIKEIEISRNIRHPNVARFLGSWIGKDLGLIFYRYMENGSLHDVLHEKNPPLSLYWNVRYKIAVGVAKGLAYLHHDCDPPILHRDVKPKNILLDSDMNPYITDLGIALTLNQSSTVKHLRSTYHLGTLGFMAPEIASTVVPSCASDVYSYGVVLLELITRRKVLDPLFMEKKTNLVQWFRSVWMEAQEIQEIVDSSHASELSDPRAVVQVLKMLLVALICTGTDPRKRLDTKDIFEFFEADTDLGIFVPLDIAKFHLGSALASAAASIFGQDLALKRETKSVSPIEVANEQNFVKKGVTEGGKELWSPFNDTNNITGGYANGSRYVTLNEILHTRNPLNTLKWNARYKIAIGIAHKLAYDHHDCDPPIVHPGCINSNYILIDSEMEPHISDFGASMNLNQPSCSTSDPSMYSTPENGFEMESVECEVFYYGVVLLELITMKNLLSPSYSVGSVRSVWLETGNLEKIVDSNLARELCDSSVVVQATKVLCVGLLCTENTPRNRPTMRNVILLLTR